jgi:O-antigen ligase
MNIVISGFVSIAILIFGNRNGAIYLVTIISSFFVYYLGLAILDVELERGGTVFIYVVFMAVLVIYLLMRARGHPTINGLDIIYILFFSLWFVSYLMNFDQRLFTEFTFYRQAPIFLCLTFVLPIIVKPIYSELNLQKTLHYLEIIGFAAATILFLLLLFGYPSKEIWWEVDKQTIESALRYAPIRGFFSNRQAVLFAMATVIFFSRFCYTGLGRKELLCKIPFVLISMGGIVISGSRGVFILCTLMCTYLVLKNLRLRSFIKIFVLLSILSLTLVSFLRTERYQALTSRIFQVESYQAEEGGVGTRTGRYIRGLENFLENPILGNGMSRMSPEYDYSHNIFISVLEDTGLLGLSWILLFLGFLLIHCYRGRMHRMELGIQPVARNTIVLLFLLSNVYGTVISQSALFLLVSMYYYTYRSKITSVKQFGVLANSNKAL